MKNNLFVLLFVCLASLAQAQIPRFNWVNPYSGYSSSSDFSQVSCATTDAAGNIYAAGFFTGTIDFDPGAGTSNLVCGSTLQGFITKTSPSGKLIWVRQLTGDDELVIYSIAADSSNGVFITGGFRGFMDCNPGPGTAYLNSFSYNSFLIKLDTAGLYKWAKTITNTTGDVTLYKLVVDHSEHLLFAGSFNSGTPDMDPGSAVVTLGASCSGTECFILKLDHDGNYMWAKSAGQRCSNVAVNDIAVDTKNNVLLSGTYFGSKDIDPGPAVYTLSSGGSYDLFISRLDSNGNFIRAVGLGGTSTEEVKGIATDQSDNIYITGVFMSKCDFKPGPDTLFLLPTGFSSDNIYVAKYDTGLSLSWAKSYANPPASGSGRGYGFKLASSKDCSINIMGLFYGQLDFDPGPDTAILKSSNESIFVSRMDSSGKYIWAGQFHGKADLLTGGIHADAFDNLYTFAGFAGRTDFDPSADSMNITPIVDDGFLHQLSICYPFDTTDIRACRSYTLDGTTYTSSGTYTQFIKSERNCDVSLTFNLKIDDVNDTITKSGKMLSAKGVGSSYQWVNCPSYTIISGATSSTFAPATDGSYALIIGNGSCVDTSDCMTMTGTGIADVEQKEWGVRLMPNPAINQSNLYFSRAAVHVSVELISLTGQLLFSEADFSGQELGIDVQHLSKGVYLLKIGQEGKGVLIKKLIKE